jgi:hypothetical protein
MPVPVPQLGAYNYVPETKVHFTPFFLIVGLMPTPHLGKPRLGRPAYRRLIPFRHPRGKEGAFSNTYLCLEGQRLLLCEELWYLSGASRRAVRNWEEFLTV